MTSEPGAEPGTVRLAVAASTNPTKTAFIKGPREMQALHRAAVTACVNKRLLKIKQGAEVQLFLSDGRVLGEDVQPADLPDGVVLLVAGMGERAPMTAALPGDCKFCEVGKGRLALWHRPGDKHFGPLMTAGCDLIVTLLSENESAFHIEREARRAGIRGRAKRWL